MKIGAKKATFVALAALVAIVLSLTFGFILPQTQQTASAANGIASNDGVYETVSNTGDVATVTNDSGKADAYATLGEAVEAAEDGDTITVLKDITDTSDKIYSAGAAWLLVKNKSLTIEGNDHTLTATGAGTAIYFRNDYSTNGKYTLTINDLNIVAKNSATSAIAVYGERVGLELNNVTLDTTGVTTVNVAPLMLDGKPDPNASVNVPTIDITISGSTLNAKSNGYAIDACNPANITIENDSTLTGWNAIRMRKVYSARGNRGTEYSTIVIKDSAISTKSAHNGDSNKFGAIVFECGNITFDMTDSTVTAEATGTADQSVIYYSGYYAGTHPSTIDVNIEKTDITLTGEAMSLVGTGALSDFPAEDRNVEVKGGSFNFAVDFEYVADGYMLAQNGDGTYGVLNDEEAAENFAAKVTSKEGSVAYKTLAAAVTAAEAGDTVTLLGNATVNPSVTINKSITIDLGGFTVNNLGTSHVFVITADGVTIENGSLTGQKVISASNAENITLKHVTITGTGNSDEAVRIYNASVTLDGVTLDAQTIGVRTWEGGSVNVIGGSKLTSDYITLWALAGTSATVNDSTINAEGGADCYYAIYAQGEVNVTNSTLNSDYIAVEANNGASVVLDKATINVTYNNGMGIGIGTGENTSVTVKGSTINADDVTGGIGIQIYGAYDASKDPDKLQEAINDAEGSKYTSLTVTGTKIDAYYSAVMGNGRYHGSFITIADSELMSETTAIYHPQYGNMTLSGNTTVTGGTGIEMRAGTLMINDDTVSVTATADFAEQANGDGSTLLGVAIGVSQHNTNAPVNVAVGGGTFTANGNGGYAFYEVDLQDETTDGVTVALSDGTFNGAVESENMSGFVSGGKFANRVPAEYLAENFALAKSEDGYKVVDESGEEIADYGAALISEDSYVLYSDAIAAIAAAGEGDTVKLLEDVNGNITINANQSVTLDVNGKTITSDVKGVPTILNNGTLKIIDTAEVKGTITRGPTTYYVIRNDGVMTIADVNVKNLTSDPSSLVANSPTGNGATLRIESGTFTSAGSNAVKNDPNGKIVIEDGTFSSASSSNAAVFNWAEVTINGGTFINREKSGKALFVGACNGDHNTTVVTGGTFEADSAVYMQNGDVDATKGTFELTIENGTFKGAVETVNQGFNVTEDDKITVTGGTFEDKVAVGRTLQAAFSGGEYAQALDPEWYAADIVQYKTEDGKYGIGETVPDGADALVVIDNTYHNGYTSLTEALASAKSYTLTLYADIDEQIVAGEGVNKAIDLNGFDITYSGNGAVITNNGKLNIKDGTKSGVSCIYKASGSSGSVIVNNGTLTMSNNGYTVSTENSDALIVNNAGGTFQITLSSVATYFKANGTAIDNSGTFKITTADNAAVITADVALNNNGEATIKGGTFNGAVESENMSGFVSGGKFANRIPAEYLAENFALSVSGGVYTVVGSENPEAKLTADGVGYTFATLEDAISAAASGDTVTLLSDAELTAAVTLDEAITFDLNGFDVTSDVSGQAITITADGVKITDSTDTSSEISVTNAMAIWVKGGTVTIENIEVTAPGIAIQVGNTAGSAATLNGVTVTATNAIYVSGPYNGDDGAQTAIEADVGDYNSLTVTGSHITGKGYGIVGNGTWHGTDITITDSTIETTGVEATVGEAQGKTTSTSIFQPQYGVLTISGNTTITGYTGIEMRSGRLVISGDGVTVKTVATADDFFSISNNSGTTLGAVAVGVSQHGTELPVDVNISGGTFVAGEGCYAFYETDNMESIAPSDGVTVALSGGTFNGAVESKNMSGFVSGGKFANRVPAEYLAENFALSVSGGAYTVVGSENPEAKLTADGVGYTFATLEDAISAAASGDTVTLLGDVTVDSTIDVKKAIDLDLGGFTVTSTIEEGETEPKPVFRFSAGDDVTIKNGTIAAKGTALEFVGTSMMGKATYTLASDLTVTSEASAIFAYGGLKLVSSATVESVGAAILTHGDERGTTNINITGGSLTSTNSVAMYLPQKIGTINISGGTITGKTGIEIRNGTLNITGGEIIATGAELVTVPNGSGSTVNSGAAVAISKYTGSINSLKVNISGGTLKGVYAVYEANLNPDSAEIAVDKMTVALSDGTFDGAVESENLTAFITGGRYASQPAEDYFDPDYIAAYRDGWFVPVESSALRAAQTDAQADVRMYAAVLGLGWADITTAAETDDDAALIAAAYEAIAETTSEKAVAEARLAAMDAVDAYIAKLAAELASYKQDAIGRIDAAAAAGEGTTAVVVPTATYAAIMNAATTAEVDMYEANAMKEIADVRAFRAEIAAQTETLSELAGSLETLGSTMGGEFDQLLTDVKTAIDTAKDAVLEGTSEQLSGVQTALETKIGEVMTELTKKAQSLADSLETLGTTIGDEFDQLLTDVRTAISEAQTATGTAITGAVNSLTTKIEEVKTALNEAVTDLTGELGTLASSLESLGTTIGGGFDQLLTDVRTAISEAQTATGTAITGAVSSLTTKIEEVRTALNTAVGQLEETLGAYNDALDGYNTQLAGLTGSLATASKELEAAIAAAQGDLDAIADKLDTLATGTDADEIAAAIAAIKTTVDSIAANVDAASAVEEAKTDALTEIEDWLGAYLDDLLGTAQTSGCVTASAYTPETEDGELYDRLVDAFGKDNAALVLKYYNDALAAIDEAQTMSDVTTAVSTFKAQVASVESASGNAPGLAGVYVLLVIVLIVAAAAAVLLVLGMMKKQPAPAASAPTADKPEEKKNEEIKEDKKEEEAAVETAAADSAADDDDDRERVVISANVRTFDEAYAELPDESRELFDKVKNYALSKEGTREAKMSNGVCVKYGSKKVVRLTVRRGNPVAMFILENEMLKDFRRTANSNTKLKVHETELVIREEADLDTAFKMVDITVEQIGKDIEAAKERRREARRARRARRAEDAAAENAADDQETDSPEAAAEAEDKTDGAEDGKEE